MLLLGSEPAVYPAPQLPTHQSARPKRRILHFAVKSADTDKAGEEVNMGIEIASPEAPDRPVASGLQKLCVSTPLSSVRPLSAPQQRQSLAESDSVAHARRQVQALVKMRTSNMGPSVLLLFIFLLFF